MAATISSAQIRLALVLLLFLAFLPGTVPEPQEGLPDKAVRGLHFSQERSSLRWLDPCNLGIRLSNVTEGHPRIGNCDIIQSRVFSNRRKFLRFRRKLKRKRRKKKKRRRVKRERSLLAVGGPSSWPRWCKKVAFFRVFEKDYTLCLYVRYFADDPVLAFSNTDIGVTVYNYWGKKSFYKLGKSKDMTYVTGYVMGHAFSSVQGFVREHRFYGTIYVRSSLLFVEPIVSSSQIRFPYRHNNNNNNSNSSGKTKRRLNAYVYKIYSRRMARPKTKESSHINDVLPYKKTTRYLSSRAKLTQNQGFSGKSKKSCQSCSLILVADYEFYRDIGRSSISETVHTMLYHVREVNALLRSNDYDEDGSPDCVGIHVQDIRVITDPRISADNLGNSNLHHHTISSYYYNWNYNNQQRQSKMSPEDYIRMFSKSHLNGHCLGILFSNKAFPKRVLGLAWRGNAEKKSGICQKRNYINSANSESGNSLNSLFITLRTEDMERIPLRMGILNLLHEILHSFGASHDPAEKTYNEAGRYLMSRYSNSGTKENHSKLSRWSKKSIRDILKDDRMSYCLHDFQTPFCGDGIIQDGEECDCGLVEDCLASKSCCVPSGGGPKNQPGCSQNLVPAITKYCKSSSKQSLSRPYGSSFLFNWNRGGVA